MNTNVLSRVAERVYWLGRYLERTDSTTRLITVNAMLLMDLPVRMSLGWRPLIDIIGSGPLFDHLYGPGAPASEHNVCRFLATDVRNPGALVNSIAGVRDNARHVRETMPRITFEYINNLYLFARRALVADQTPRQRDAALEGIGHRTQQIEGFLSQNMRHDAHWELLRLGNHIERADMTTRIIDVRSANLFGAGYDLEPFQDIQWRSVLRSFYAMQAYNAAVREPLAPPLVLEFLFKDDLLPRSYLRCLMAARRSLRALPRSDQPLRVCQQAIRALKAADVRRLGGAHNAARLHRFIDHCQIRLSELHDQIASTYFDYRPPGASGAATADAEAERE